MLVLAEAYRSLFKYVSVFFLLLAVTISVYYMLRITFGLDPLFPIGENFVVREVPSPKDFPIYAKPITYIVYSIMLAWLFGLEALRDRFSRISFTWIELFMVVSAFLMFLSGYEMFYNFTIGSALMASQTQSGKMSYSPDLLVNSFPNPAYPVNLVFATKIFSLIFFVALYFLLYLLTVIWKKGRGN